MICRWCMGEIALRKSYVGRQFCARTCYMAFRKANHVSKSTRFTDSHYHVYALTSADEVIRYVGSTTYVDVDARRVQWIAQRFRFNNPVSVWVRDVIAAHQPLLLKHLETAEDLQRIAERKWILQLQSSGLQLLNQQTGGLSGFTQPSWNKGLKTGSRKEHASS